jgi:hypothetical protein
MTVPVVVLLEAVEVDHRDVDLVRQPPRALELAAQLLIPGAAVRQPGQLVCARHRLHAAQQFVALALGLLAGRDVADDACVERPGSWPPRQQTELQRELAAVLAHPGDLDRASGIQSVLAREQLLDLEPVEGAVAGGEQLQERFSEHLGLDVAEGALGGRIEVRDPAAAVRGDHCIHRYRLHL